MPVSSLMFSRFFVSVVSVVGAVACSSALPAQEQEVRVGVSDLMASVLAPVLDDQSSLGSLALGHESVGSLPALSRMRSGEIDLAIVAIPAGEEVPRDEFRIYPFAYDAAVFVVNENNPLNEISLGRLGGIYGSSEEYNFNSWGDLGLSGWGSRKLKPLTGAADDSIALELFKYTALQAGGMKSSVVMVRDNEVEAIVEADPASIALMSRLPTSQRVKVLMVSSSDETAYGPTVDNIHYGDYPVRLNFYIMMDKRDEAAFAPILRTLLNEVTAEALSSAGFFPLPETVRRKLTLDLDLEKSLAE